MANPCLSGNSSVGAMTPTELSLHPMQPNVRSSRRDVFISADFLLLRANGPELSCGDVQPVPCRSLRGRIC